MLEIMCRGLNLYKVKEPGVIFRREEFEKVMELLEELGYSVKVIRFGRSRHTRQAVRRYLLQAVPLPPPTLEYRRW